MPAIDRNESGPSAPEPAVAEPRAAQRANPRRLPSLDGWRAVSILMVLGAHCHRVPHSPEAVNWIFSRIFTGDMGVRCFFVISGLLITWLMLGEHETSGRISLKHFYIRRALRILPVYFAFLAALWSLQMFTPFAQSRSYWISNLTFTTNFVHENYASWPSGHLWSLSVEEQFYILWPVLLVACALAEKPRLGLCLLSVPLLVAPVCRMMYYKGFYPASLGFAFSHFSFFNYFDCLAVGCICAFLLRYWRPVVEMRLATRPWIGTVTGLAFIGSPHLFPLLHMPGRVIIAAATSLESLGFAALLMQSILLPQSGFYTALNWKWVRHLGVLSYSIYIWQEIFCTDPATFGWPANWWMSFPGWMVSALVAAHLSYYILERPLLRLRAHFR